MASTEEKLYMAKIAEQSERYEDMSKAMKSIVQEATGDLTEEERNLLSVSYKNMVGGHRTAWRIINSLEEKARSENSEWKLKLITEYKKKIEKELNEICDEVLDLLDKYLIQKAMKSDESTAEPKEYESKVFYLKMKGDYIRYKVEVAKENREELKDKSQEAYRQSYDLAVKNMPPTSPIRLGLALNFSVFHYEIAENSKEAIRLAKEAFDEAIPKLEDSELEDSNKKDCMLIMQLLRDNLTLWQTDQNDEDGFQQEQD